MRILINAASAKTGGALTYILGLLPEFARNHTNHDFFVVLPDETIAVLAEEMSGTNVQLLPYASQKFGTLSRMAFDQLVIPGLIRRHDIDILFSSTGYATLNVACPQLLLIRNAALFCPEFSRRAQSQGKGKLEVQLRRRWALASARASDLVLYPTAALRDLVERTAKNHVPSPTVLPYGFDRDRFTQADGGSPEIVERIEAWKKDGNKILVHVSDFAIHKNVETLVEAIALLRDGGHRIKLVTTIGRERTGDKAQYDELVDQIAKLNLTEDIAIAGFVNRDSIARLYEAADLFVFPSLIESFGHPLVEAMASGLPIVASDTPTHREICGPEAARYFAPLQAQACSDVLIDVLRDDDKLSRMGRLGKDRSERFTWGRYCSQFLALCEELVRECPQGQRSRASFFARPRPLFRPVASLLRSGGNGASTIDSRTSMEKLPIAVILLTLNEEQNLPGALENVTAWAQQVFVVDSLSSDRTVDIAYEFGVPVVQRPFTDFGDQWNWAIEKLPVSAPWTMKLDPDERVTEELIDEIRQMIGSDSDCAGYSMRRRLWFGGRPLHVFSNVLRLWRTGQCRFSDTTVNEHPLVPGTIGKFTGLIEHLDSTDMHRWYEKQNHYSTLEAITRFRGSAFAVQPNLFGSPLERRMFLKKYFYRVPFRYQIQWLYELFGQRAILDGRAGWTWAGLRVAQRRAVEIKLRAMQQDGRPISAPQRVVGEFDARVSASEIQCSVGLPSQTSSKVGELEAA